MPTSTQILPPSGVSEHKNLWRLLQLAGLALITMVVGAGIGVWAFGPSVMGESLGQSRITALNSRIQGVFEHTDCTLHWTSPGTVHGLRLADEEDQTLVHGDVVVPALTSAQWREGTLPTEATLDLKELVLAFDQEGVCSLLDRLTPRSRADGVSPFMDPAYLGRTVHYIGTVAALKIADERALGGGLEFSDVRFDLRWKPEGLCRLQLNCSLGADGAFTAEFQWNGMGANFDLPSIVGSATLIGATATIGEALGIPRGLTAVFGEKLHLNLELGGTLPDREGVMVTCKAAGERHYAGRVDGFFTGDQWTFSKSITEKREGSAGTNLPSLDIMHSQDGYALLLRSISQTFLPLAIPAEIRSSESPKASWSLDVLEFVSGVAPMPTHLPFLEGWLATCRFDLNISSTEQHELAALEGGPRADPAPLEQTAIRWTYDGSEGSGRGLLHAQPTEARKKEKRAVAIAVSGSSSFGPLNFEELKLGWLGKSPYPILHMEPEEAHFEHLPSQLFAQLMGDLGKSCALALGRTFEFAAIKETVPTLEGTEVEGWRLKVGGLTMEPESPIYFYSDGDQIWSDPEVRTDVYLNPGWPEGIFEITIKPFMPWFEELGEPQDRVRITFEDLLAERTDTGWAITGGRFAVSELDLEYSLQEGWDRLWGDELAELESGVEFSVEGKEVNYTKLELPLGTFVGNVDLQHERVKLTLTKLNEVSSSFFGLGAQLKVNSMLSGPYTNLQWSVPLGTGE